MYTDLTTTFVYKGLLTWQQQDALAENDAMMIRTDLGGQTITPASAVIGLTIDQDYDVTSIKIDSESTANEALRIEGQNTLARTVYIVNEAAHVGGEGVLWVVQNNAGSSIPVVRLKNEGTGYGLLVDSSGGEAESGKFLSDITAGGVALRVTHDGNNANRDGMLIENGTDNNSGTNTHIWFARGDGVTIGQIDSTGGVVSYRAFTGAHTAQTKNDKEYEYGTVMVIDKIKPNPDKNSYRQPIYILCPSKKKYDKKVFGIYSGRDKKGKNSHRIYALGDGHILVTKQGGNIEIGDYLTTSDKENQAMKQNDDLLHNYTIAKALEDTDWKKEKKDTKLIAVTYHAA